MDEHNVNSVGNMDSLVFQLVLETRELTVHKDEIERQIEIHKSDVAKKKSLIEETKRSIEKLKEIVTQKENLVSYYKDNAKSLKVTNNLLSQYEKTLQVELERKEEISDQDMKMYQERIENYRKVYEQHKARYCEIPLVKKLIDTQTEKEGIEQRIRACDEQILMKERELETLQGKIPPQPITENASESASVHQNTAEPLGQKDLQAEESESAQIETGISSLLLDPQNPGVTSEGQNNADTEGEESMNVNVNQERDFFREEQASPPFPAGIDHNIAWINQEAGDQLQVLSQERAKEVEAKEKNPEVLGAVGPEQREVHEAMQEPHTPDEQEGKEARAYPHTPPARMKAVPSTPIFTLNSPGQSPGHYKPSDCKSPAFMFSINTTPETPGFSAFDCAFDTGSPQEEDMPFSFTSSYFGNKKSSESKSSAGFLIDQMESKAEEEFELFFSSKSPTKTSTGQEQGGANDDFSFFNFGKV